MKTVPIETLDHSDIQVYQKLRENIFGKDGSFIADSPNVVKLMIEAGVEIKSIFATPEYYENNADFLASYDIPVAYVADKSVLEEVVGHRLHHNVMMHALRPRQTPIEALGDHIVMLTEISNADNIGAIARSAAALGVEGYLVSQQGLTPTAAVQFGSAWDTSANCVTTATTTSKRHSKDSKERATASLPQKLHPTPPHSQKSKYRANG